MNQNGLIFCGALLGKSHIRWGDKGERKAGEMLTLFVCPRDTLGTLDVKPEEITVPSESISIVEGKLKGMKQLETVFVTVERYKDRLTFKSFLDLK